MKYSRVILDADICIKIGTYEKHKFLEILLPNIAEVVYIHKYVYENEVLTPRNAKEQIDNLINLGIIEIVDEDSLDFINKRIYQGNIEILKRAMIGTKEEGKNWGEVLSISMAHVMGIPYFMSDEGGLQEIIDYNINKGMENDIRVVRIRDIIKLIKENPDSNITRKTAKAIWRSTGNSNEYFDTNIWTMD